MLNFTVGPVQMNDCVKEIGMEEIPYFRTADFSKLMIENEKMILDFFQAPKDSRAVFLTCSGTGSMEATIINTLTCEDRVIVVNGGTFGERFVELLSVHNIPYSEIKLNYGKALKKEDLEQYNHKGFTAFVINLHETSTGVLYDIKMISDFCRDNNLFLIVDSISSFLADPFEMGSLNVDVAITGSQKALACPPGISIIVLSARAVERTFKNTPSCMYLDLKLALKNQERGQTPFTPAVGTLRQINARLLEIKSNGGEKSENKRIANLATYFRSKIKKYPFNIISESMSNAVTPLHPLNVSAYSVFEILKDEYGIWVCPNGGQLKETVFRVGHIGNLTIDDYDKLFEAFDDMLKRGLL